MDKPAPISHIEGLEPQRVIHTQRGEPYTQQEAGERGEPIAQAAIDRLTQYAPSAHAFRENKCFADQTDDEAGADIFTIPTLSISETDHPDNINAPEPASQSLSATTETLPTCNNASCDILATTLLPQKSNTDSTAVNTTDGHQESQMQCQETRHPQIVREHTPVQESPAGEQPLMAPPSAALPVFKTHIETANNRVRPISEQVQVASTMPVDEKMSLHHRQLQATAEKPHVSAPHKVAVPQFYPHTTGHISHNTLDTTYISAVQKLNLPEGSASSLHNVMEKLDPHGELDTDCSLLEDCAVFAARIKRLYEKAHFPFPEDYLVQVYERDLAYLSYGLESFRDFQTLFESSRVEVETLTLLFDLDQSQVGNIDAPDEFVHIPRSAWRHLTERIAREASPIRVRAGPFSDRPQLYDSEQTVTSSRAGLKEYATKLFIEAGILEYFDPSLAISTTDGPVARQLPGYLQSNMRRTYRYLSPLAQLQVESGQFDAIAENAHPELITDLGLEYHSKVGVANWMVQNAPLNEVFMAFDDMESVRLLNSTRIRGVHIHEGLRPLLPDEALMYRRRKAS
jgi:hypothetical protein